jgi:hypothetical protein
MDPTPELTPLPNEPPGLNLLDLLPFSLPSLSLPGASGASAVSGVGGLALALVRWAGVGALVVVVLAAVVLGAGKYV